MELKAKPMQLNPTGFLEANEFVKKHFFSALLHCRMMNPAEAEVLSQVEKESIQSLAMELMWAMNERKALQATVGANAEEHFLQLEVKLPAADTFVLEDATSEELRCIQHGVWAKVVRLAMSRGMMDAVELMELYYEVNEPYFRMTWLQAQRKSVLIQA